MIYDLHSHSTASDGSLSPTELVQRAHAKNVDYLALTDHDTVNGIDEAQAAAKNLPITLIPGIELSAKWQFIEVHIIGLFIDPLNPTLLNGIHNQQLARRQRVTKIIEKLNQNNIPNAESLALSFQNGDHIGKPLVAKFLVDQQITPDYKKAYSRLNRGGDLYELPNWELLQYVISWIKSAGGIAVLAHPSAYGLNKTGTHGLVSEFKKHGGKGIEVSYGNGSRQNINRWSSFSKKYQLHASVGSDFHRPTPGIELGKIAPLPKHLPKIWELFPTIS